MKPFTKTQAPTSNSLWADAFGLGHLLKLVTDPALGQTAQAMMISIIEASKASGRIEAKLDALLREYGHDPDEFKTPPPLLAHNGAPGTGGDPAPGCLADDGGGANAPANGAARSAFGRSFRRHVAPDDRGA